MGEDRVEGRVLVVDDDPDLRRLTARVLARAGYEVLTAAHGAAALEHLGQQSFNAVLSDILMPDMDGVALLRNVRNLDLDVPVILMTGSPDLATAVQAVEYGALRYIAKPVAPETLREAVGQAVRLDRLARLKRQALTELGGVDRLVGDRAGLEAAWAAALASVRIAYQPIVRAADGGLVGHEALVRTASAALPHPEALFGAAEKVGGLRELGRAIRAGVAATRPRGDGLLAFVNLHPHDLLDPALVEPGAPLSACARSVVLEVTERASLGAVAEVQPRVAELRRLGYRIAVDDLGAGYAGLSSFAALQPDVVKLDISLVRDVDREPVKRKLVASLVALCRDLRVTVLAEGVETPGEREVLVELGCEWLQGYLFGRPVVAEPGEGAA